MQTAADEITKKERVRKEKARRYATEYLKDPVAKAKQRAREVAYKAKPSSKEKARKRRLIREATLEYKEKARIARKLYESRPENRKHIREKQRYYNSTPVGKAKVSSMNAARRAAKRKGKIGDRKAILRWEMAYRAKRKITCYWCRQKFAGAACQTDHILPISKGGAHSLENLCVSCSPCNQSKKAKLIEAWNQNLAEPVLF